MEKKVRLATRDAGGGFCLAKRRERLTVKRLQNPVKTGVSARFARAAASLFCLSRARAIALALACLAPLASLAFDGTATVYVNGTKAGSAGGFARPAVFDLTGRLAPEGGENLVVIRIARRQNAEVLTGGLLYPSFLFAGPRVPSANGAEDAFKIILPGAGR